MIVVDFIVICYFILFRRAKQNQLKGSLYLASVLPISFIFFFLICYSFSLLFPGTKMNFIVFAITWLPIEYLANKTLDKHYIPQEERLNRICDRFEKLKYLSIVFLAIFIVLSIFLIFYSMTLFEPGVRPSM